jgi:DivIVA domain-containing protein
MSADLIGGRRFAQTWRGYDPEEVKQFLAQVGAQVRSLRERLEAEAGARREAEQRALHPRIDEATLMSAVGEETAGILHSARAAAADISAKAEARAQETLSAAEAKASALTAEAERLLSARTSEAEAAAAEVRATAEAEADQLLQSARQEAERIAAQASADYRQTVEEAQAIRERVLSDLARRRKLATVQIEQLRAGRERLLDAYLVVRRTLDEVTGELHRADAEARAAAEAVGRQSGRGSGEDEVDLHWGELPDDLGGAHSSGPAPATGAPRPSENPGDRPARSIAAGSGTAVTASPVVLAPRVTQVASAASGAAVPGTVAPLLPRVAPTALPGDTVESVRILRRESSEGKPAHAALQPAPAAYSGPGPGGSIPQPSADVPASAPPPDPAAPAEATTTPSATTLSVVAMPPSTAEGSSSDETALGLPAQDVDGLFARIRASRQQTTSRARKTLFGHSPSSEKPVAEPATPELPAVEQAFAEQPAADGLSPEERAVGEPGEIAEAAAARPVGGDETMELAAPAASGKGTDQDGGAVSPDEEPVRGATDWREVLGRRDEAINHLESSLARRLKRVLQDEQNSILDRLRSLKAPAVFADVLPGSEEHADRFVDASRPVLEESVTAGAELTQALVGSEGPVQISFDVGDLADELGRSIVEPLRQRIEEAFGASSEDASELAEVLGAAYREWKTQRIEAAASDQVLAAFSRGAYLALPEGVRLRWVVDNTEGPCPDCEDNTLAGEQGKGEVWPTGQLYPPAHPGCRCALAPASPAPLVPLGQGAAEPL